MSDRDQIVEKLESNEQPATDSTLGEDWLAEHTEREWDDQIERDAQAGRLDFLIDEALEEHRAGRTRPL